MAPNSNTSAGGFQQPFGSTFSFKVLGWGFLVCALLLTGVISYFVFVVLNSLTQPTPLVTDLISHFVERAKEADTVGKGAVQSDGQTGSAASQETQNYISTAVNLAIILEYANADIRGAGVQVAFSLVSGLFFATLGILLFAAGSIGQLDISGVFAKSEWRLSTAAPGIVAIVLGGIIIAIGVHKDMSRPLQADVMKAVRMNVSSGTSVPPNPQNAEGAATDQKTEDK